MTDNELEPQTLASQTLTTEPMCLGHIFKLRKPLTANVDLVEFEINHETQGALVYQAFLLKREGAYQGAVVDLGPDNLLFLLTAKARQHINLAGFLSRLVLPFLLQSRPAQQLICKHIEQAQQFIDGFESLGIVCDCKHDDTEGVVYLSIPAQAGLVLDLPALSDEVYQQSITDLALKQQSLQQLYQQLGKSLALYLFNDLATADAACGEAPCEETSKAADPLLLVYLEHMF